MSRQLEPVAHLRDLSPRERGALVGIMLVGALLRFMFQAGRSFFGDEVGTLLYMQRPASYIVSHFDTWLTQNYYILFEKMLAMHLCSDDWCLVAPTLLASIASIPAVMSLALKLSDTRTAFAAAVLTALNPYLIGTSSEIRSYSLLVLFSVLALDRMLSWMERPTWRNALACSLWVFVGALLNLNMMYTITFLIGILLFGAVRRWVRVTDVARFLLPLMGAGLVLVALYWRMYPELRSIGRRFHAPPPTFELYPTHVFMAYMSGTFDGDSRVIELAALMFMAAGIYAALRRGSRLLLLVPGVILPFVVASLTGLALYPWSFARYFIAIVPYVLILIAAGAVWMVTGVPSVPRAVAASVGLLLVATAWCPRIVTVIHQKNEARPFKRAASVVIHEAAERTRVVAFRVDNIALMPYFRSGSGPPHYAGPRVLELLDVQQASLVKPDDFFFLATGVPLRTGAQQRRIGDISIVRYVSDARGSAIERFREDLKATIAGDADPALMRYYEIFLALSKDGPDPMRQQVAGKLATAAELEHSEGWTPAPLRRK